MQFKAILLLSLFCCFQGIASLKELETRNIILNTLPEDIATLSSKSKVEDIKKKFQSKILKQDDSAIFLKYFTDSNDLTLGMNKENLSYVYVKADQSLRDKNSQLFSRVYSELNKAQKEKINQNMSSSSHGAGRFIKVDLPEQGVMLEFTNNEAKSLHSVTFWTPGEKHP